MVDASTGTGGVAEARSVVVLPAASRTATVQLYEVPPTRPRSTMSVAACGPSATTLEAPSASPGTRVTVTCWTSGPGVQRTVAAPGTAVALTPLRAGGVES
jgi:hypothetical protein